MVKVKICGITNLADAKAALYFGADAVGFLIGKVHPSTGFFLNAEEARDIIDHLPPFCSTVLVTHLSRPQEVVRTALEANVNTIQLHGDTTPEEAREIKQKLPNIKLYKVVHVFGEQAIADAKMFEGAVEGIVLDTANRETGQVGGTGKTHDWSISQQLVKSTSLPVILAGGLNPENVNEAISKVRPYAVDVNSGVNNSDGTKDHQKLQSFIERAKGVNI